MKRILVTLLIIALISGCIGTKPENVTNATNQTIPPVVDIAKNDLAKKLNITVEQVSVISIEKVDWPDTSLGYPEEGKMYAQVITPGYRIVLKAQDKSYEYHSDYERVVAPKNF